MREITEIEEQILESVVKIIGRELESTWPPVLEVQFTFDSRLRQADISRLMPPSEKILSLSFEIRMPESRGMLNIALPAAVANALLRKLTQQASYRKQRGTTDSTSQMLRRLEHCVFPIQLVLPEQPVRVSQILALEQGDVLKLNCSLGEAAHLLVSGKELFTARPVRAGRPSGRAGGWTRAFLGPGSKGDRMSTEEQAPHGPKLQSYLQAWGTSIGRVLQEVAGAPHTWQELSPRPRKHCSHR